MPELNRANQAIERAAREREARLAHADRFKRQLAATDRLLDLLERMNLEEVECVGAPAARRISRTLEALPPCLRPVVRPSTTVQDALDQVFETQRALFRRT
jgi:hypothetical protein